MSISHLREIRKLTFRALALRRTYLSSTFAHHYLDSVPLFAKCGKGLLLVTHRYKFKHKSGLRASRKHQNIKALRYSYFYAYAYAYDYTDHILTGRYSEISIVMKWKPHWKCLPFQILLVIKGLKLDIPYLVRNLTFHILTFHIW